MRAIRADKMVLDYRIYPRTRIDPECVQMMEMAFRAGTKFPPVLIDNKSHRVIDGFHRITMFRRIDAAYPIEAVERQYADEAHMFADAVRLNANHGKNLSIWDRKHCLRRGAELGIEVKTLAAALSMTVEVAGELLPAPPPGRLEVARRVLRNGGGRTHRTESRSSIQDPEDSSGYPGNLNQARANQVLDDIAHSLEAIDTECERLSLLLGEAGAGSYWNLRYASEEDWKHALTCLCVNIKSFSLFNTNAKQRMVS